MKTFLLAALLFSTKADAQLSNLLTSYYNIKNALVSSNANTAAAQADEFVKALKAIDIKSLSEADRKALEPLQEKLVFDAEHIAETKDISHQRDHFESFSENFYKLAKAVKLSDKPIYQSYYGSQMLTCGKVSDTIK
jgi:hypothetical protein